MLIVDAANVVGARPTGWWRDRPGAAARLVGAVRTAVAEGALAEPVVVVLEGAARAGADEGSAAGVRVAHAAGSGDDAIAELVTAAAPAAPAGPAEVTVVVTADRELRRRVEATGATTVGPSWLYARIGEPG